MGLVSRFLFARRARPRGQASVELAMTFPVVFGIIVAVLELGFLFNAYTTVVAAARQGARAGAVYLYNSSLTPGQNQTNRESGGATPSYQDNVQATVARAMGNLRQGLTYDLNISYTQAIPHFDNASGDLISVNVVYHYRPVTEVFGNWEIPIKAESSERME